MKGRQAWMELLRTQRDDQFLGAWIHGSALCIPRQQRFRNGGSQFDARKSAEAAQPAIDLTNDQQVIGQKPVPGSQERSRQRRLSRSTLSNERYGMAVHYDGCGVERLVASLDQREGQHVSKQIGFKGLGSR